MAWTLDDIVMSDHKPLALSLQDAYSNNKTGWALPKWTFKSHMFKRMVENLYLREGVQDPMGEPEELLNRLL